MKTKFGALGLFHWGLKDTTQSTKEVYLIRLARHPLGGSIGVFPRLGVRGGKEQGVDDQLPRPGPTEEGRRETRTVPTTGEGRSGHSSFELSKTSDSQGVTRRGLMWFGVVE